MSGRLEARAFYRPWNDDLGVFLTKAVPGDGRYLAEPLTFRKLEEAGLLEEPTFTFRPEQAQALMDDLWNCGMRPTQGKQSEGVNAAQGNHLADMRAIAFAKLNVAPPSPQTGKTTAG